MAFCRWLREREAAQAARRITSLNPEVFKRSLPTKDKTRRPAESLTAREKTVAARIALGLSNAEIAGDLKISIQTVKNHLGSIFEKVGVTSRLELATWLFNHDSGLYSLRSPSGLPQQQKRSATDLQRSIPDDVRSSP
jgi:DNA-binding CsgD family transcriptional regulator